MIPQRDAFVVTQEGESGLLQELTELLPSLITVDRVQPALVIGPGRGQELAALSWAGKLTTVTLRAQTVAEEYRHLADIVEEDFHFTTLPTGRFSLIVCRQTIEHSPAPYLMLAQIRRVLADHGRVFLTIPDAHWADDDSPSHVTILSWEDWCRLFERVGLDVAWCGRMRLPTRGYADACSMQFLLAPRLPPPPPVHGVLKALGNIT